MALAPYFSLRLKRKGFERPSKVFDRAKQSDKHKNTYPCLEAHLLFFHVIILNISFH